MFLQCFVPDLLEELGNALKKHGIIPDVVDCVPALDIGVYYPCSVSVRPACALTPEEVQATPIIRWMADPNKFYTMVMVDPDAPSRKAPIYGQFLHWLIGNIPGCDAAYGDQLAAYIGSQPAQYTGYHRYVFLVFQQICHLDFDEPYLTVDMIDNRNNFNVQNFARKYALGKPIRVNFFLAKYTSQKKS